MEFTPFSSIQCLTTAVYTNNPSFVHEDDLANEALVKYNLCMALGLSIAEIDEMLADEVLMFKIIVETIQRREEDNRKSRDRKGKSMLPSGLPAEASGLPADHRLSPESMSE